MSGENRFTAEVLDPSGDTDHAATYQGFVKYSIVLALACFMILVSLCIFAFAPSGALSLIMGFGGLIIGLACVIIDSRLDGGSWFLSGGFGVLFALVAAMLVV